MKKQRMMERKNLVTSQKQNAIVVAKKDIRPMANIFDGRIIFKQRMLNARIARKSDISLVCWLANRGKMSIVSKLET